MRSFTGYLRSIVMIIIMGGLMLFPLSVSASAPIAYEQPPGHEGGFFSDGIVLTVADQFQFDEPTRVGTITWWGCHPGSPASLDRFKIWLFADDGGQPGTLLQGFDVGNTASRTTTGDWLLPPSPDGDYPGCPEFQYSYNLPEVFWAAADTTYWISIVNGTTRELWSWEFSGSPRYPGIQRIHEGGPWTPYVDNVAFRLSGKTVK